METFGLVLRVIVSLAIVMALIWALARVRKRVSPKGASALQVISKVPVSKRGALLLVEIGDRTLLLGSTDESISLLTEVQMGADEDAPKQARTPIDFEAFLEEWQVPDDDSLLPDDDSLLPADDELVNPEAYLPLRPVRPLDDDATTSLQAQRAQGPLAGSVLSPTTWRQFTQVLRERTVRS